MESYFRAFRNLVSEHSIKGVPTSLYNLTKSVPDPLSMKKIMFEGVKSKKATWNDEIMLLQDLVSLCMLFCATFRESGRVGI